MSLTERHNNRKYHPHQCNWNRHMVKGEFFHAGLAMPCLKKFVIYFTQKNISRFEFKKRNSLQIGDCFFFEDYSIA